MSPRVPTAFVIRLAAICCSGLFFVAVLVPLYQSIIVPMLMCY